MLHVVLFAALVSIDSARPIRTFTADPGTYIPTISYAADGEYEYLATPAGLLRSRRIADPSAPLETIAFADRLVYDVAVHDGALYVAKDSNMTPGAPADHAFLRSTDRGATFTPLDHNLSECLGGECRYLAPTDIRLDGGRIFTNAGGNIVATTDGGSTWSLLEGLADGGGRPTGQLCPIVFERVGDRLLFGGECPLDDGYLRTGVLRPDGLGWSVEPVDAITPEMENRNVQFIRNAGGVVWAGIEGALLKSTDGGTSYDWSFWYPLDAEEKYPYPWQFLVARSGVMLIGGFDKKDLKPYLAYSANGGDVWVDVSSLVMTRGDGSLSALFEDRDGRLLAIVQEGTTFTIHELTTRAVPRKRRVSP